jgi:hypothetical protein
MSAVNIKHQMHLDFGEWSDKFMIAVGDALADEIDDWAKGQHDPKTYSDVMVLLQSDYYRICDHLDAKSPVSNHWLNRRVKQPEFWDHSLDSAVALTVEEDYSTE